MWTSQYNPYDIKKCIEITERKSIDWPNVLKLLSKNLLTALMLKIGIAFMLFLFFFVWNGNSKTFS